MEAAADGGSDLSRLHLSQSSAQDMESSLGMVAEPSHVSRRAHSWLAMVFSALPVAALARAGSVGIRGGKTMKITLDIIKKLAESEDCPMVSGCKEIAQSLLEVRALLHVISTLSNIEYGCMDRIDRLNEINKRVEEYLYS